MSMVAAQVTRRPMKACAIAVGFVAVLAGTASADTPVSDQAAALVVYPAVFTLEEFGVDTIIQLSNTSTEQVGAKCYYVNALGRCSASPGAYCLDSSDCPQEIDQCIPQWVETDFTVYITPRQPLAWLASRGLDRSDLPLNGTLTRGPRGESNAGSRVPPFGVDALSPVGQSGLGELKCYAINPDGSPSERNVLKGEATFVINRPIATTYPGILQFFLQAIGNEELDVSKYNAIGFRAIEGANNGDNRLVLGGDGAEYDGCAQTLILDHFFDFAVDPVFDSGTELGVVTGLVLTPCTENFLTQVPSKVTAQYLVYNEFEQRFSTSRLVDCFFISPLSLIDTRNPQRSIFSVFVGGTLTGQTRIRPVNGGLIGMAIEAHVGELGGGSATFNLQVQGEREGGDVLTVVH